ncbi:MAG: tRNA (adenosine(37)-N6)-threonylcarbamoyltransferase complex ATPase subunit type 1 TsaE [Anaerolineae bacterium]|nr:tRNA (adenosine(37)-N6)-threonylcarbamoyltransferase complex ATPase subunit type 1 TsaE [Anaerolineae bacterium]
MTDVMPVLDRDTLDLISHSPAQTRRLGARLGMLLHPGDVVCLQGELGTGKTRLAQGIGRGLGVTEPITSPSYTLIAEYCAPSPGSVLYHVDLYRLEVPVDEALAMGLDEYLGGSGVTVIEWADRVRDVLPDECLWIELRHLDDSKRGILMKAHGDRYRELLLQFRASAFGV